MPMIPILVIKSPKQKIIVRIMEDQPRRITSGCNIFLMVKNIPIKRDNAETNRPK